MSFFRVKSTKIKGVIYSYFCIVENTWNSEKKQPDQKVKGNVGKVRGIGTKEATEILLRDNLTCQKCGIQTGLTIAAGQTVCVRCNNKEVKND